MGLGGVCSVSTANAREILWFCTKHRIVIHRVDNNADAASMVDTNGDAASMEVIMMIDGDG